ncbi:hypothetical protein ACTI_69010 [Actinoplanes sp. OR16]|uniref:hypothetical protein n=1 Tax=Actinoplanes sp. OR16 TaxID=946334 RepID=UPI000F6E1B1C|nr:hypothetical protein [Actinoplanes sp. OR16]BBH70216.1 hypothetical protein ACTI_69010 [Actinoplanes sp. OR16]
MTGGVTGFFVMVVLFAVVVFRSVAGDGRVPVSSAGLVLGGLVGAVLGLLAGLVAGLILVLPATRLRDRRSWGRGACGLACAGAVVMPFPIAGFGWGLRLDMPVIWWAAGLALYAGLVGAGTSRDAPGVSRGRAQVASRRGAGESTGGGAGGAGASVRGRRRGRGWRTPRAALPAAAGGPASGWNLGRAWSHASIERMF